VASLADVLRTTPFQITSSLVRLSPYISFFARLAQIISWESRTWYDSWLLLLGWFAVCLFSESIVRYSVFPLLVLGGVYLFKKYILSSSTAETILLDLHVLQSLLPQPIQLPQLSTRSLIRLVALCTPFTVVLTNFIVPPRAPLSFTWRAPWATFIRRRLWASAWLRWTSYHIWSRLTETPLPYADLKAKAEATKQATASTSKTKTGGSQLRFLFTVYENQRWWMGLDFTAALLPNERSFHPVQPPTSFSLPESTSVVSTTPERKKIKRTAKWIWEDPEWRVLVHTEGSSSFTRVEKPLPSLETESSSTKNALIAKAANRIQKDKEASVATGPSGDAEQKNDDLGKNIEEDVPPEEELLTDVDGWIYGDNKWEARAPKGGMGKYTRYRRWTRVAIVEEHVEDLPDDYEIPAAPPSRRPSTTASVSSVSVVRTPSSSPSRDRDQLRNRLKSLTSSPAT
ncbi:Peroxin/Dysferlin domain-containing protein, partial [Flagelloscypha sp. PMI_526]